MHLNTIKDGNKFINDLFPQSNAHNQIPIRLTAKCSEMLGFLGLDSLVESSELLTNLFSSQHKRSNGKVNTYGLYS